MHRLTQSATSCVVGLRNEAAQLRCHRSCSDEWWQHRTRANTSASLGHQHSQVAVRGSVRFRQRHRGSASHFLAAFLSSRINIRKGDDDEANGNRKCRRADGAMEARQ